MKKTLKNITLVLLLAFTTLSFVSCGYEPVFYGIMHDVLPQAVLSMDLLMSTWMY